MVKMNPPAYSTGSWRKVHNAGTGFYAMHRRDLKTGSVA